jgi:hypothetical protein
MQPAAASKSSDDLCLIQFLLELDTVEIFLIHTSSFCVDELEHESVARIDFDDLSSSDDDSDIEDLLDDDTEQFMLLLAVKELQNYKKRKRPALKVGRLCIPRNHALENSLLMREYFAEVPTYPTDRFRRRYQIRRSLFVKIVEACEGNCRYFTRWRNAAGYCNASLLKIKSKAIGDNSASHNIQQSMIYNTKSTNFVFT